MRDTKRLIKELEWWWDAMRTDEESDKDHTLPETIERLRALHAVFAAAEAVHLHVMPNDEAASVKLTALQDALAAVGEKV